jgi:chemotaxis protein methyltransferase CheR
MDDAEFAVLRRVVKARSGLDLGPEKRYLAESRLAPLATAIFGGSLSRLVEALGGAEPSLVQSVVEAMATHETMFFRDRSPFDVFRNEILPGLVAARAAEKRLRIWSAAASTGQEAYSLAMLLAELGPRIAGWDVSILATDISATAIAYAQAGTYTQFEVQRGLPVRYLLKHFTQTKHGWTISAALRKAVEFRQLNLLDNFSALGRFDVIFCRNVLIYLDRSTKASLLDRLARQISRGGAISLGGAETAIGLTDALALHPNSRGFFVRADEGTQPRVLEATG